MIETTIPEINVSDLMERIRAKAGEIQKMNARGSNTPAKLQRLELPALGVSPPPPPLALPRPAPSRKERVLAMLEQARAKTEVSSWIPKPGRRFFRKQGGYNRILLESVTLLSKANAELASRIEQLTACIKVQQEWLREIQQNSEGNLAWMSAATRRFDAVADGVDRVRAELQEQLDVTSSNVSAGLVEFREKQDGIEERVQKKIEELWNGFRELRSDGEHSGEHVRNLQREVERSAASELVLQKGFDELLKGFHALRTDGEQSGEHVRNLQREVERSAAAELVLQKGFDELLKGFHALRTDGEQSGEHVRNLQREVERSAAAELVLQKGFDELLKGFHALRTDGEHTGEHLRNLQSETTRNGATAESFRRELDRFDERLTTEGAFLRAQLSNHDSLMQRWTAGEAGAGSPLPRLDSTKKAPSPVFDERFDAFYMSFEDRFRGSRNEIKERISFYLPYVWESNAGTADRPILDLGCGRGEWLELLREVGANARGVDINLAMLALCRHRNLDVIQADALEFLRSLPDNSLGAVTGFHIIEHLPFATLMDIFGEAQRVVEPGGFVIFESPNCKNLIVGASNFNIDPTHRNPVFPETAEFMLNSHGFQNVELQYLSSVTAAQFEGRTRQAVVLNELLYGPQDFAVIGHKPAAG